MPDDPNVAGGAVGEPTPAPEATSSLTDKELLASLDTKDQATGTQPDPKAELWKQLESIDPRELPESVRQKLEAPFLSQYGKKTSELDNERQRLLGVIERLATKPGEQPPTVDQKKQLLEEIANGNTDAIEGLVERLVAERTGPQMDYINMTRSIEEAARLMPDLSKYQEDVGKAIVSDPVLAQMAAMGNRQFASRVLAGLAYQRGYMDLKEQNAKLQASIETAKKQAVEDYKNQLKVLPPSTSMAGKTPTGYPAAKPMTLEESMEKAYAEVTGQR